MNLLSRGSSKLRYAAGFLVPILIATGSFAAPAVAADESNLFRIDVGYTEGADVDALLASVKKPIRSTRMFEHLNAVSIIVEDWAITWVDERLKERPDVRYAEESGVVLGLSDPVDQANADSLRLNGIPAAREAANGGEGVVVAVLDTEVTPNSDLGADRLVQGQDFVGYAEGAPKQPGLHGTLVANLIAAPENNVGITGVCPKCKIMPVRVLRDVGADNAAGHTSDVAAGIVWAADQGADVINLSLATRTMSRLLQEAVQYAASKDVVTVGAVKNLSDSYPAAFKPVLAVDQTRADHGWGPEWIDLRADSGFTALGPEDEPTTIGGSSGAAAVTSGAAALLRSADPDASATKIQAALIDSAYPELVEKNLAPTLFAIDALRPRQADAEAPVVAALGLDTGEVITQKTSWLQWEPVATDNIRVAKLELLVDGRVVRTGRRSLFWWVPAGVDRHLELTIRAYDHAGNVGEKSASVQVDNLGPALRVVAPVAGTHYRPGGKVAVEARSIEATRVSVDVAPMTRVPGTDRWTGTVTPRNHIIGVDAWDARGNLSIVYLELIPDSAGPTASRISPSANKRLRGTFTTSISGIKDRVGLAKVELWVDGRYAGAGASRKVSTGKKSGNVKLVWKLTDKVGNLRSYTRTVIADNKGPSTSITKAPKNKKKVKGKVKVYVKASDASGVARVELLVNGKVVAKDTKSGYVLSVNTKKQKKTMKVRVRAYDKLGNVTYTSTRTWYRS
jgi:hypothetical protein